MKTAKEILNSKPLNEYPMWVRILTIPGLWVLAALKIAMTIPTVIIGFCNSIMKKYE